MRQHPLLRWIEQAEERRAHDSALWERAMTVVVSPQSDGLMARRQYDVVYRILHWVVAFIFALAIPLGFFGASLASGQSPRAPVLELHESLGLTLLRGVDRFRRVR